MSKFALIAFTITSSAFGMQQSFEAGKQEAVTKSNGIEGQIKSGNPKTLVPQFQEGFQIDQGEIDKSFENLERSEYGKDLRKIHKIRKPYILDDTELFMVRSEKILEDPKKEFEGTEVVEESSDGNMIETCEECPKEEYVVKAHRTKINLVYITAGQNCPNHGYLTIKVEMHELPEGFLSKGGPFSNVEFISVKNSGAYSYETYNVDGYNVTLKKTIQQNGYDWINPQCYLVPSLKQHVLNPKDLINNLLGLNQNSNIYWGQIGYAQLSTIGNQFYFIFDDKGTHYERLVQQGLCSYESSKEISRNNRSISEEVIYACHASCKDTCAELRARGCSRQPNPECVEKNLAGDKCLRWRWKFICHDRISGKKHTFSKKNPFCIGGDCIDSSYQSDKDLIQAMGYLSILEAARKEFDEKEGENINIFKGTAHSCNVNLINIKDCCKCSGWGINLGITGCDESDRVLGILRSEGKCVRVGDFCAEKIPIVGTCIRKKHVFCCFGSKFAKLLQEQGKPQLGLNFGSPKEPNCRGFTPDELSRIDFSKLDLTEITNDIMDKFKPVSGEHFAKDGELNRIREHMEKQKKEQGGTEAQYLQENMKHLTASLKGGRK